MENLVPFYFVAARDKEVYRISSNPIVKQAILPMKMPYGLIGARLLGLSYVDYLRYIESKCGARIEDPKGPNYFFDFYFTNKALADEHAYDLSERWETLFPREAAQVEKKVSLKDF